MNPETRAARDRLTAFADAMDRSMTLAIVLGDHHAELDDLRLVLAVLDQQPDGIIICDHQLTQEEAEDLKRRFTAAQHDGTPIRMLDGPPDAARLDYRAARRQQDPHGTDQ